MEPLSETAAPVRAEIGEDIPRIGGAQVGGRTKRRVNPGFASGAASDGLWQQGAAGTLECADGVTGDHRAVGHEDVESDRAAACGKTKEGSGWWKQPREAEGRAVKKSRPRCPHNRERHRCKECGGSSICEHKRERRRCKECGGSSICEHKRRRSQCKECGGAGICEHNRIRSRCKECGGAGICEHNRQRHHCKECGRASFCEHNRQRSECRECGGSGICEHKRRRVTCKECGGGSICEHKRIRRQCKACQADEDDSMPPDLEEL